MQCVAVGIFEHKTNFFEPKTTPSPTALGNKKTDRNSNGIGVRNQIFPKIWFLEMFPFFYFAGILVFFCMTVSTQFMEACKEEQRRSSYSPHLKFSKSLLATPSLMITSATRINLKLPLWIPTNTCLSMVQWHQPRNVSSLGRVARSLVSANQR